MPTLIIKILEILTSIPSLHVLVEYFAKDKDETKVFLAQSEGNKELSPWTLIFFFNKNLRGNRLKYL